MTFSSAKLTLLALVLFCTGYTEAAVGKKSQINSLSALVYTENPFTYKAGAMIEFYDIQDGNGLVVRVQPVGTYMLFTEDLLFCGHNALGVLTVDKFREKKNPMVITYETTAHRAIDGIGCHDLVQVHEINTEKIP